MIARPGTLTEIFEVASYVRNLEQDVRELRADRDGMSRLLRDVLTDDWQSTDIRSVLTAADVPHAFTFDPHSGVVTIALHGRDSRGERSAIDSDESMSFSWCVFDADAVIRSRMAILVALRSRFPPVGG